MVTVIVVMELTTLEKFIIKCSLRLAGTVAGVTLALLSALFCDLFDHHPAVLMATYFIITAFSGTLAKKYSSISYIFTMVCITFTLVFSGYVQHGWATMWGRFFSVFVGATVAFWSVVAMNVLFQDLTKSLALVVVLARAEKIFGLALVSLDLAFIQNEARAAAAEGQEEVQIEVSTVQKEVREFFHLEEQPSAEKMCSMAEASQKSLISMDANATSMWTQCKAGCSDMQLVRKMIRLSGKKKALTDYTNLVERVHLLAVQATALGHAGQVEARYWTLVAPQVRKIRGEVVAAHASLAVVWQRTAWQAVRETLGYPTPELHPSILAAATEVTEMMKRARKMLDELGDTPGYQPRESGTERREWRETTEKGLFTCLHAWEPSRPPAFNWEGTVSTTTSASVTPPLGPSAGEAPDKDAHSDQPALLSSRCLNFFIHSLDIIVIELSIMAMLIVKAVGLSSDEAYAISAALSALTGADHDRQQTYDAMMTAGTDLEHADQDELAD
jgi:hypothetical protein